LSQAKSGDQAREHAKRMRLPVFATEPDIASMTAAMRAAGAGEAAIIPGRTLSGEQEERAGGQKNKRVHATSIRRRKTCATETGTGRIPRSH